LPWRGVTASTFQKFEAKTKIDSNGKPISIGFRYPNGDVQVRLLDKKDFYFIRSGSQEPRGLFGRDKFAAGSHSYVTITEGALDACSLYQVMQGSGSHPVVSVLSSGNAVADCTADRSWLNSFERIYLAFDGDAKGRQATKDVARLFDYGKVFQVKFTNRKDANEYLQAHEGDVLRQIWFNSKRYVPESIINTFGEFEDVLNKPKKLGIPYPFKTLTDMTYGIRTGETVLITAQEKVGKTELMHAIEYQILTETDANVGAFFLEESQSRHLQALAGLHLKCPTHLPDCDKSNADIIKAVREVVQKDERLHLYTYFGSDDPEILLDTIRFLVTARNCRYILLDHISMVVSGLASEDERRKLDYLATRLEMMVKELDFALLMVSHVNDFGQTRGSRYLTKVSDITINATRDTLALDPIARNTITLSIPYNRFCGITGPAGTYVFDQSTYSYREANNDDQFNGGYPSNQAA
jgi:twinkle protein